VGVCTSVANVDAEALGEHRLDVGPRAGTGGVLDQVGDEGVGLGDGQAGGGEAAVVEAGGAQPREHRLVEGRVIPGVDGVQGDPHERGLDHGMVGEGLVELGRVEAGDPVPQGSVTRQ